MNTTIVSSFLVLASIGISTLCSADSHPELIGQWRGPCSDGTGEKMGIGAPYVRMVSTMSYDGERASWEMKFFTDGSCDHAEIALTYAGAYSASGGKIEGKDDQVWVEALSQEVADEMTQEGTPCSAPAWKVGDRRDVTRCSQEDGFLGSPYSYGFKVIGGRELVIGDTFKLKRL
jgi:hypothetical protein